MTILPHSLQVRASSIVCLSVQFVAGKDIFHRLFSMEGVLTCLPALGADLCLLEGILT
jgi:hypothetical protein